MAASRLSIFLFITALALSYCTLALSSNTCETSLNYDTLLGVCDGTLFNFSSLRSVGVLRASLHGARCNSTLYASFSSRGLQSIPLSADFPCDLCNMVATPRPFVLTLQTDPVVFAVWNGSSCMAVARSEITSWQACAGLGEVWLQFAVGMM